VPRFVIQSFEGRKTCPVCPENLSPPAPKPHDKGKTVPAIAERLFTKPATGKKCNHGVHSATLRKANSNTRDGDPGSQCSPLSVSWEPTTKSASRLSAAGCATASTSVRLAHNRGASCHRLRSRPCSPGSQPTYNAPRSAAALVSALRLIAKRSIQYKALSASSFSSRTFLAPARTPGDVVTASIKHDDGIATNEHSDSPRSPNSSATSPLSASPFIANTRPT